MKQTSRKTLRFFLKHLGREKLLAGLTFLGITIGVVANLAFPIVMKEIIDLMTLGVDKVTYQDVSYYIWVIFGISIINMLGWRLGEYALSILEPRVMASISKESFEKIHQHSFNFFNNEFVGSLVKRVNRMTRASETFMDIVGMEFTQITLRIVISIIVLTTVNPFLGIAMTIWALLFLSINFAATLYKLKHYNRPAVEADTKQTGQLADSISNNVNVKLFSAFKNEQEKFNNLVDDLKKKQTRSWIFSQHIEFGQNISMIILELFMFLYGVKLWSLGQFTVGEFVLVQAYLFDVFIFVWDFSRSVRRLYEAFADAEEMTLILHTSIEVEDKKGAIELDAPRGEIEFKNVEFAYEEGEEAIKGLKLKIQQSEKVALIGPSGGGKTTIVKLILRLFDIDKGTILIDGKDISEVTQDSLRAHVALVPQDPILFHRSLMDNIRYGRHEASDEEVIAAAKLANCHDFISKFKKKYGTFVGERGVKLSGGERQRIAIARAILSNARILILDEATSNLDVHSEKLIQNALEHLMQHKTTIVIAHRLSTVRDMDRILVLEDGKLVEQGGHAELMNQEDGLYKSLWDLYMEGKDNGLN